MEKTIVELKDEIIDLAHQGLAAARAQNLPLCREIRIKMDPLLRDLGKRMQDDHWIEMADYGMKLVAVIDKRMSHASRS